MSFIHPGMLSARSFVLLELTSFSINESTSINPSLWTQPSASLFSTLSSLSTSPFSTARACVGARVCVCEWSRLASGNYSFTRCVLEKSFTSAVCSSRLIRRTSPSKTLGANEKKSHITSTLINDISPLFWNWKYSSTLSLSSWLFGVEKLKGFPLGMTWKFKKGFQCTTFIVYRKGVEKIFYLASCTSSTCRILKASSFRVWCNWMQKWWT